MLQYFCHQFPYTYCSYSLSPSFVYHITQLSWRWWLASASRILDTIPIQVQSFFGVLLWNPQVGIAWCQFRTSIISGKLKLNFLSVHILIPFFLLGYSEIQFQSCLSLHHPNNCCDQFPCPSFNFSNHAYFYLVVSDWITHYHLFDTCFVLYLVSFLCYHSIDRQTTFGILISISYFEFSTYQIQ